MPTVRVDEMVIHPRDNALVVGTHGRALWVLDNVAPLQEMAAAQKSMTDATLFSTPPTAMYRRPARDRNYEFWGDQTFYGENPPNAAVISWHLKKDVGSVSLRITDATGRETRELSGDVLRNSNKAGIQAACWDLRVQPVPNPDLGQGGGRQGGGGGRGGGQDDDDDEPQQVRFGAGCTGGGFGGGNAGPFVLPGTYTVELLVNGKAVGSKPLRVMGDPEVILTQAERKRLYDMAMELHDLQRRANGVISSIVPVQRQMPDVMKQVASKSDLPADVKTQAEAFQKELTEMMTSLVPQGGRGRGGRGGGGTPSPIARAAQAKNGMMGGMWPTQVTMNAYNEAKSGFPGAVKQVNDMLKKAQALSAALSKHGITLNVPAPTTDAQ
jgi:hypothetical protein